MTSDGERKYKEIKELYDFVAEQVLAGLLKWDVVDKLIEMGVDRVTAMALVGEMERQLTNVRKREIILITEDEVLKAELAQALKTARYDVFEASQGEEGFELIQDVIPALIIVDEKISDINTNDLIKRLRVAPIGYKIPIFVVSDNKLTKDAFEVHHLLEFYEKPLDIKALVQRIKKILVYPRNPRIE